MDHSVKEFEVIISTVNNSIQRPIIKRGKQVNDFNAGTFRSRIPPLLSNKHPAERTLKEFIKVYTNINLTTYEILIVCF